MTAGDTYTIAGSYTGQQGSPGNGGPGNTVLLEGPTGLAMDSSGDLYIADSTGNQVDEMTPSGQLSTVTGNGHIGTAGDSGPAGSAQLDDPTAVAFDSAGDVYIADAGNNRVQEIFVSGGQAWGNSGWTAGDIYTVAGSAAGTSGRSANSTRLQPAEGPPGCRRGQRG
jgi:trimeric autotransporter adhesin